MIFTPTHIADVVLIQPDVFEDARGFFLESWQARKFAAQGLDARFVQDNHSYSRRWVLRGLHYQVGCPQGKLVRVVRGEAFDVALDVRRRSPTFGQWVGEIISGANRRMLWVPPGFAHGFLALSDEVDFLYQCTEFYDPAAERAIAWNDPDLAIRWPLPTGVQPILAEKDRRAPLLREAECFL